MVWKLWPEQKFKVRTWLFQKSRTDNFRTQTLHFSFMCSISVCSFKLIPFMVWKLWPEQKFKVRSWLFQKSRADNFRTQTAIKILGPRYTTRHHGDALPVAWKEYCAEYWLYEFQESSNCRDITEKLLKTALNTIQSINIDLHCSPKLIKTLWEP